MSLDNSKKQAQEANQLVDHLFRSEYGKMVSYLTKRYGFHRFEWAEDIAQDTLMEAYQNWSYNGLPANPQAWLFTVAKNKALNFLRRQEQGQKIHDQAQEGTSFENPALEEIEDSMLRMIFACCHPDVAADQGGCR